MQGRSAIRVGMSMHLNQISWPAECDVDELVAAAGKRANHHSEARSERVGCIAGRAFDDLRQGMKEQMLEMLMWARINREKRQKRA